MLTSLGQLDELKVNPQNSNYLHMADDVYVFFRPPIDVVKGGRILPEINHLQRHSGGVYCFHPGYPPALGWFSVKTTCLRRGFRMTSEFEKTQFPIFTILSVIKGNLAKTAASCPGMIRLGSVTSVFILFIAST